MCNTEVTIDDYTFVGENGVSILKRAAPPKEDKEGKDNKDNKDKEKERKKDWFKIKLNS